MKRRAVSGMMLTLLLISMLTLAFDIPPTRASGTIYIRPDGSVEGTDKIQRDGDVYTFTDDINDGIVVERDNVVVDGADYTIQGTGLGYGVSLSGRNNVTLKNMQIKAFDIGVCLIASSSNTIVDNTMTPNANHLAEGVYISYSNNNTVSRNTITTDYAKGVYINWFSNSNTISRNTITVNMGDGVFISSSSNGNTVFENTIKDTFRGIDLSLSSNGNTVFENNITDSIFGVTCLYDASDNTVSGNTMSNAWYGVYFIGSSNNFVFHNNFVDNGEQACSEDSTNVWDDGYPSGGNYWSDYTGEDANGDGIGDTPYIIDGINQDNYPLMEPWLPSPEEIIQRLIETLETWKLPAGTENSLTAKLKGASHLLSKENVNGAIHKLKDFIGQVEALRGKKLTTQEADELIAEAQRIIDLITR